MALDTNLLAYYKMSNGAYTTDSVASYTLTSSTSTQQSGGFSGYCGSGDNIYYAGNYGLTGTSDVSISWWVKFTTDIASGGSGLTFFNSTLTTDRFIALDYNHNGGSRKIDLYASNNSITGSYTVTLGTTWHHIAITRSSGTVKLYLDGVERISGSQSTATGSQDRFYLGTGKAFGGTSTQYYDESGVWSRALTADDVAKIYNAGRGNQYPFTDDLTTSTVAYWKLDESSGNASDSVGSNTLTNTNTATYVAGKINNGVNLVRASSQYLTVANDISIQGGAVSISCWINATSIPSTNDGQSPGASNNHTAISIGDAGTNTKVSIVLNRNSNLNYVLFSRMKENVDVQNLAYQTTLSTSTWYHLVMTYDGATITGYVNGSSVGTASASGSGSSGTTDYFNIGSGQNNTPAFSAFFDGKIDEVGVWSRAITSGEVTQLYNSGAGLQYPFTSTTANSNFFQFF